MGWDFEKHGILSNFYPKKIFFSSSPVNEVNVSPVEWKFFLNGLGTLLRPGGGLWDPFEALGSIAEVSTQMAENLNSNECLTFGQIQKLRPSIDGDIQRSQ